VAEEVWGIERLIDPEDILDAPRPDEKIIMTYMAEWFKCFAKFLRDEAYVNAILAAIEVTKKHEAWILEYKEMAGEAKVWMEAQTAKFTDCREGKDGHGDSTAAIKATLDAFYRYKHEEKPSHRAVLTNVEGHLSTLHASQRNNDRWNMIRLLSGYVCAWANNGSNFLVVGYSRSPLHVPLEEVSIVSLEKVWQTMEENEDTYEQSIRDSYSHFQRLESTVMLLKAKCVKLKAWMLVQQVGY
jgi:hypothetical protein